MSPPEPKLAYLGTELWAWAAGHGLVKKVNIHKIKQVPAPLCRPQPVHPHVLKTGLIFLWTSTLGVDSLHWGRAL